MKHTSNNCFVYATANNNKVSGFFNIYQGKNGAIYLQMGSTITLLAESQLHDLGIDLYPLAGFDINLYQSLQDRTCRP